MSVAKTIPSPHDERNINERHAQLRINRKRLARCGSNNLIGAPSGAAQVGDVTRLCETLTCRRLSQCGAVSPCRPFDDTLNPSRVCFSDLHSHTCTRSSAGACGSPESWPESTFRTTLKRMPQALGLGKLPTLTMSSCIKDALRSLEPTFDPLLKPLGRTGVEHPARIAPNIVAFLRGL